MKNLVKILFVVTFYSLTISGCNLVDDKFEDTVCDEYEGNQLYKTAEGKCYYIDSEGKIVTVADSECEC